MSVIRADARLPRRAVRPRFRWWTHGPLYWGSFGVTACVLVALAVLVIATPLTISAPISAAQAAIVVAGTIAALAVTWIGLARIFTPLERVAEEMERVDLLAPRSGPFVDAAGISGHVARAFERMIERLEAERLASSRRAQDAQEAERRRIARDLHDEVGQLLTAVRLELDGVGEAVTAERRDEIAELSELIRKALDEVRRICRELRPEMLEQLGLASALTELARRFARLSGVAVECDFTELIPRLEPAAELAIYRIVQESLTNVGRHARAGRVSISLRAGDAGIVVRVVDDGGGLHGRASNSGILGMRERAALIGATLAIRSGERGGTEVRLDVPAIPDAGVAAPA